MNKVIELFQNKEIEKLKQENESKSKTIQKLQDFIYKHLVEDGEKNGSIEASKTLLNTTGYKNIPKLNSNIIEIKIQDRRLQ